MSDDDIIHHPKHHHSTSLGIIQYHHRRFPVVCQTVMICIGSSPVHDMSGVCRFETEIGGCSCPSTGGIEWKDMIYIACLHEMHLLGVMLAQVGSQSSATSSPDPFHDQSHLVTGVLASRPSLASPYTAPRSHSPQV